MTWSPGGKTGRRSARHESKPETPPERVAKKKRALDPDTLRVEQAAMEGRWLPTETVTWKSQTGFPTPTAKKKGAGALVAQNVVWVMQIRGPDAPPDGGT